MKTYAPKPTDITRAWYILDASEITLGRLASETAKLLIGKAKPSFSPHLDAGDYVVIINAASLRVTGNKPQAKIYYRHSGYPGNLHQKRLAELPADQVIKQAVRGMLPVNKLRAGRLARLKIYLDEAHQHAAQSPTKLSLGQKNGSK